ncbi:hypothetical protein EDD11_001701 [Mortierella claussenii]|nr:hypothetical protein EDD11_001701 [Mortierella claussenii]
MQHDHSEGCLQDTTAFHLQPKNGACISKQHSWLAGDRVDTFSDFGKKSDIEQRRAVSSDGTSAIRNSLLDGIRLQAVQPVLLTHLSLLRYEFLMDEWIAMMQLMPSLQELDLDIISILPGTQQRQSLNNSVNNHSSRRQHGGALVDKAIYGSEVAMSNEEHSWDAGKSVLGAGDNNQSWHAVSTSSNKAMAEEDQSGTMKSRLSYHTRPEDPSGYVIHQQSDQDQHYLMPTPYGTDQHQNRMDEDTDASRKTDSTTTSRSSQPGSPGSVKSVGSDSSCSNMRRQFELADIQSEERTETRSTPKVNFPSVRSLIFRGTIILPELLESLPNLESLALEDAPYGPRPSTPVVSNTLGSTISPSASLILELANVILDRCPHICRLVLNEPSLQTNPRWLVQVPLLLRATPQLLHFVTATSLITQSEEIVETLLHYHGEHLRSFLVQDASHSMTPERFFQQQQQQQDTSSSQPLHQNIHGHEVDQQGRLRRLCLRVLETCPNLQISDCKVPLPVQDVIASFPNWACRYNLTVLRLELSEMTDAGMMDREEEAILEMFVRSLFSGSRKRATSGCSLASSSSSEPSTLSSTTSSVPSSTSVSSTTSGSTTTIITTPTSATTSDLDVCGLGSGSSTGDTFWASQTSSSFATSPSSLTPSPSLSSTPSSSISSSSEAESGSGFFGGNGTPLTMSTLLSSRSGSKNSTALSTLTSASGHPRMKPELYHQQQAAKAQATSFLSTCSSLYQVESVGKLTALQFLVEHQLATMPCLDHFFLGSKMFRLPRGAATCAT